MVQLVFFQQQAMLAHDAIYPLSVYHRLFCCLRLTP